MKKPLGLEETQINGESWFKIANHDRMRPFFINIVSDSNHWMFISSNGGLTAGRKNSSYSLFPYYTDDKITESADITGSKTIFQVQLESKTEIWEPFSVRYTGKFELTRNIYKSFYGNKIMFEEINYDLGLTYRYQWNSSNLFGFLRKSELMNHSGNTCRVSMLDGIQNLLPYGVEPDMQAQTSNLVDAYKKNELVKESGLGIYALSAIIVDKAEPSEALKANVAWSLGIENPTYLLSSLQLDRFRNGEPVKQEEVIKGEKGAYFVQTEIELQPESSRSWKIVANVNQNHAQIIELDQKIRDGGDLETLLEEDIERGSEKLKELIAGADGLRLTSDPLKDARHFSNVLFNIMRGGTFDNNYTIEKQDLASYLKKASKDVFKRNREFIQNLDEVLNRYDLLKMLDDSGDPDLVRLCREYLPLKFSRRHGDPSRPWNYFTINTQSEIDGSKILDYEGNWRDLFQNWEALVHSYPGFIDGMIFKFLNTSTFDGYNPYRVTKGGFDWETIEPDNPWSYIGYWGDHQIIYLLKLLEFYQMHQPDALKQLFTKETFVYANVPYRIKSYKHIAEDPKNTIDFDEEADRAIRENIEKKGTDGALLELGDGKVYRVNFLEKILATTLAKISNFIPEGGIWLNTQRPEWNDANNALVGNGVSMVTLYYLRRFLKFFEGVTVEADVNQLELSEELLDLFNEIKEALTKHKHLLNGDIDDLNRKKVTDLLGEAGSKYRNRIYEEGFSGKKSTLKLSQFSEFVDTALRFMEHSIEANRRTDGLYHSYNIMGIEEEGITISYLSEMLEGQVAILSSGYLKSDKALNVLKSLRSSSLYRKDQNSYILYPNKELPGFLEKNSIPEASVLKSPLLKKLLEDGNHTLITKDIRGGYHFNGNFRNAGDVKKALEELKETEYKELVKQDGNTVLEIFEEVFNHKAFTGRSGTFFAYEGLGSIYWHMVSKLYLAVAEVSFNAIKDECGDDVRKGLLDHFYEIGEGIGIHKSPELHGAFPTDAYSHTPAHRGAQQPGMTGQVKEDILTSLFELGLNVENGVLGFEPLLLRKSEFRSSADHLQFIHTDQTPESVQVPADSLCFSICQIPVLYSIGEREQIEIEFKNGKTEQFEGLRFDLETSARIFQRTGEIKKISVSVNSERLTDK
ncbi:MAG: hypothetical protein EA391_12865 [Balneolaceae bacterium]|nr:MAG: hypothetical protein EA391_12865 [Balneolaceae bacterium]